MKYGTPKPHYYFRDSSWHLLYTPRYNPLAMELAREIFLDALEYLSLLNSKLSASST